uniref:Uncharacterized protein n=1 Tax=Anguilla anguilla TaxID=7936 RepID=A0A0E9TD47_ANGAN
MDTVTMCSTDTLAMRCTPLGFLPANIFHSHLGLGGHLLRFTLQ